MINASYFFTSIQMMHRRILKGEQWRWYFEDLALPFTVAILVAGTAKLLLPAGGTRFETIIGLLLISGTTFLLTVLLTKATRDYLILFSNRAFDYLRKNDRILQK
jgi:hypothetical protein